MDKQIDTFYYSLYKELVMQIYTGTYKKGDELPSLRELCDIYGVGRNTARSALQLLQAHGYIKMEPRKQAVISFDIENPQYQKHYLIEAVGRKTSIKQVYDFMELVMPEIFVHILKSLPHSLRKEIAGLVGFFSENLSVKTEARLQAGLMQLYRLVIALPDNQLLEQLFSALFSYVQLPVSSSEWNKMKFQAIAPFFKSTFKRFQKLIVAQEYDMLGKQIGIFCRTMNKRTEGYLDKFSRKAKLEDKGSAYSFTWSATGKPDYVQLASVLVHKIGRGDYKMGDILPSYALLAKENGVSEITSRNAIEILGKLGLVITTNGVGTKAKGFSFQSRESFIKDIDMRRLLASYFEALQLFIILCRPVLHRAEEMMTEKEKADIKKQLMDQGVTHGFEAMLSYAGLPASLPVFTCLKNELAWGYLLNFDIDEGAIRNHLGEQESSIAEKVCTACKTYFNYSKDIVKENSIEISLSIL